nr:MAG TPA: Protein of unknown function (DUF3888) [Caudoviricetes sp.]
MNDTEVKELVELLLPYIKKEIKNDNDFKTNVKRKNATVVSVTKDGNNSTLGQSVQVKLAFDNVSFSVPNETGKELASGDLVCIEYCIDLKNAVAVYKV